MKRNSVILFTIPFPGLFVCLRTLSLSPFLCSLSTDAELQTVFVWLVYFVVEENEWMKKKPKTGINSQLTLLRILDYCLLLFQLFFSIEREREREREREFHFFLFFFLSSIRRRSRSLCLSFTVIGFLVLFVCLLALLFSYHKLHKSGGGLLLDNIWPLKQSSNSSKSSKRGLEENWPQFLAPLSAHILLSLSFLSCWRILGPEPSQ